MAKKFERVVSAKVDLDAHLRLLEVAIHFDTTESKLIRQLVDTFLRVYRGADEYAALDRVEDLVGKSSFGGVALSVLMGSTPGEIRRTADAYSEAAYRVAALMEPPSPISKAMAKIPNFPNEIGANPVVAIDLRMRDGVVLRLKMPDVQQSRVMVAIGRLAADLDVPLDFTLPEETEGSKETR